MSWLSYKVKNWKYEQWLLDTQWFLAALTSPWLLFQSQPYQVIFFVQRKKKRARTLLKDAEIIDIAEIAVLLEEKLGQQWLDPPKTQTMLWNLNFEAEKRWQSWWLRESGSSQNTHSVVYINGQNLSYLDTKKLTLFQALETQIVHIEQDIYF